jgi:O-antigen/teichoic acid export membrane protein
MISKRALRNLSSTIVAQILPIVSAVGSLPVISARLSPLEFGIYTIFLSLFGFLSILDFGLGRTVVRFVSLHLARHEFSAAKAVLFVGARLLLCGAAFLSAAGVLAIQLGNFPQDKAGTFQGEYSILSILLVLTTPIFGLTILFRSVLEAKESFGRLGIIQAFVGVLTYLLPALIAWFSGHVIAACVSMILVRVFGLVVLVIFAYRELPLVFKAERDTANLARDIYRYIVWLAISNVVGALIVYGDRFVVALSVPVDRIAYYIAPVELLSKLMIAVGAATTISFPFIVRQINDRARLAIRMEMMDSIVALVLTLVLALATAVSPYLLERCLGTVFMTESGVLTNILLIGIGFQVLNAFGISALAAFAVVRPVAVVHLVEMPLYFVGLYFCSINLELTGVAGAWSTRMILEFIVLRTLLSKELSMRTSVVDVKGCTISLPAFRDALAMVPPILYLVSNSIMFFTLSAIVVVLYFAAKWRSSFLRVSRLTSMTE